MAVDPGPLAARAGGVADAAASQYGASKAAFVSLLLGSVVWGLIWWPLKHFAGMGLDGHAIGLTAYSLVALVALPLIWRERRSWKSEAGLLALIGLFFGCANMAFTMALSTGSVVRAMLLFYLLPAWGAIGGALFLGEHVGLRRLTAVALSLGGVLVIMGGPDILLQPLSVADGMALAASLGYTAAGIANRKARQIPLVSRTLVSFVGCMLVSVLALSVSVPETPTIPALDWAWLVLFAFIWLLGGTLLTTYGVTHLQASRASILQVVELLVAVLSAVWLGGEHIGIKEGIGGAMIIAATLIEANNH